MKQTKKWKGDLILVGALLTAALLAFVIFTATMKEGAAIIINIDGEQTASYPIDQPLETDIVTGDAVNTLVIADGKAQVTAANCPDKVCVGHRAISKEGETIVCLPHKLVITVTNDQHQ